EEARAKKVDAIILLSGDADFVPAIQLIKSYKIKTANLHTYAGSSTELRNACDEHILIDFDEDGFVLK
ncbi:MAG: NYN domain-containing protein, partial [Candidatus Micrarchaeota archaeon]